MSHLSCGLVLECRPSGYDIINTFLNRIPENGIVFFVITAAYSSNSCFRVHTHISIHISFTATKSPIKTINNFKLGWNSPKW